MMGCSNCCWYEMVFNVSAEEINDQIRRKRLSRVEPDTDIIKNGVAYDHEPFELTPVAASEWQNEQRIGRCWCSGQPAARYHIIQLQHKWVILL